MAATGDGDAVTDIDTNYASVDRHAHDNAKLDANAVVLAAVCADRARGPHGRPDADAVVSRAKLPTIPSAGTYGKTEPDAILFGPNLYAARTPRSDGTQMN